MTPAWAQRHEAVLRDGLVSPDVFAPRVDRLGDFVGPDQHALETAAGQRNVPLDLQGLLSPVDRKNAETLAALVAVERLVRQDCIGTAPWDHRPVVHVLVGQGVERWGEPEGRIAFDPSSVPTRGTQSVGVKRPWGGHRGTVDNGQVGVDRGSVSRHHHAVLDCRWSLPQAWAHAEHRRHTWHVPEDVSYRPRHDQGLERLDAWGAKVPHGGVTGADARGRHTRFRRERRARGERDGLGGPCHTTLRDLEASAPAYRGRGRRPKAPWQSGRAWRPSRGAAGWTHWPVRAGENGPVQMARVKRRVQPRLARNRTGPEEGLVVSRRPLADDNGLAAQASRDAPDPDPRSREPDYLTPTPAPEAELTEPSLVERARVINAGTGIEASFKRGKREAGMDEDPGRTWEGWPHHMALSRLAVWFRRGETPRGPQLTAALTLPHVRYGLSMLLREALCTFRLAYSCRQVQRQ